MESPTVAQGAAGPTAAVPVAGGQASPGGDVLVHHPLPAAGGKERIDVP